MKRKRDTDTSFIEDNPSSGEACFNVSSNKALTPSDPSIDSGSYRVPRADDRKFSFLAQGFRKKRSLSLTHMSNSEMNEESVYASSLDTNSIIGSINNSGFKVFQKHLSRLNTLTEIDTSDITSITNYSDGRGSLETPCSEEKDLGSIATNDVVTEIPSSATSIIEEKTTIFALTDVPEAYANVVSKMEKNCKIQIPLLLGNRYSLIKLLGEGSYGSVIEAIDIISSKKVAVKRIINLFKDLSDTKRIIREIQILRQLQHSNVVKILNVILPPNETNFNEIYVVFEKMDTDLHKLGQDYSQVLTLQHIHMFMSQLLNGIKYLHDADIIHRDLKPANLLLNEDCSLKICDFGLSRYIGTQEDNEETESQICLSPLGRKRCLTQHVVTRWYRAPELILLDSEYTKAIDVWSAGCIFSDMLSMMNTLENGAARMALFPGKTCFPLSPGQKERCFLDQQDQLNTIFDIIGTPTAEDIESITETEPKLYLKRLKVKKKKNLKTIFPKASSKALDLLAMMLTFDPKKRISVDDALSHPFFTSIRQAKAAKLSKNVKTNVKLNFNDNIKMDEDTLRKLFIQECNIWKSKQK